MVFDPLQIIFQNSSNIRNIMEGVMGAVFIIIMEITQHVTGLSLGNVVDGYRALYIPKHSGWAKGCSGQRPGQTKR